MNSISSLTHDGEIFKNQVIAVFGELDELGFQINSPSIKHTAAIGNYIEIEAVNADTGVSLLFTFAPAVDIRPDSISVFLQNGSGDTFSIGDFLSSKKADPNLRKSICLAYDHGSLGERIEATLSAIKEIISKHLEGFLIGSKWESVPIQWGDMK